MLRERCFERDLGYGRECLGDGQPSFAASAASTNARSSIPGTSPTTRSAIFEMPVPGTKVTVASTFSDSGGVPACASPWDSAIEKHEACAAASSSSGVVCPSASSDPRAQLTGSGRSTPLPTLVIVPAPSVSEPFQVTCAVLSTIRNPLSSRASTVTVALALMSVENGQPASAASAAVASEAASAPGATARAVIADATIWCPLPSTSSIVIVQCTCEALGRRARTGELAAERRDEAGRMSRGEELLGARLSFGLGDP